MVLLQCQLGVGVPLIIREFDLEDARGNDFDDRAT